MATLLTRLKTMASRRHASAIRRGRVGPRLSTVADELAIDIDADGSPVSMQEADWLVCFVPGLRRQWWHRFAHPKHKHVFAIRMVDDHTWLLVEPWWTRLMVNVLTLEQAIKFLRWGAAGHILKVREAIPGRGSQMRGWSNCAVLTAFLLGRSYWTWTPDGLYRRLRADTGVEQVDLAQFLDGHFRSIANEIADEASRLPPRRGVETLEDTLLGLGIALMTALSSVSAIGLHKTAIFEPSRFGDAAAGYLNLSKRRTIDRICSALEEARLRDDIDLCDCGAAAHQFVAMLLGGLPWGGSSEFRPLQDPVELRIHALSVVAVFLRGALYADTTYVGEPVPEGHLAA